MLTIHNGIDCVKVGFLGWESSDILQWAILSPLSHEVLIAGGDQISARLLTNQSTNHDIGSCWRRLRKSKEQAAGDRNKLTLTSIYHSFKNIVPFGNNNKTINCEVVCIVRGAPQVCLVKSTVAWHGLLSSRVRKLAAEIRLVLNKHSRLAYFSKSDNKKVSCLWGGNWAMIYTSRDRNQQDLVHKIYVL